VDLAAFRQKHPANSQIAGRTGLAIARRAGVEFIDENGRGAGVRLQKPVRENLGNEQKPGQASLGVSGVICPTQSRLL
jgi:hypothetical protein